RGLGLSGQMHGAVLVDDAGRPLTPALLWPDERATAELDRWRELPAADRAALANPLVAGMTGPLAAWLGAHEPAAVAAAAQMLLPGWRPAPADDPPVHGYADATDGWYRMAALRNAGSAWAWVCRVLGLDWAGLFAAAEATPAGAGGVVFRPFLAGERGGVAGPADRGSWTGLGSGTTREDLARAAVEGVVFAVAAAAALVGEGAGELLVTGGGARAGVV